VSLKKASLLVILILLLTRMLTLAPSIQPAKAQESSSEMEPVVEFLDFNNGTRQMIIDYENGTRDYVTETFIKKTARFLIPENNVSQSSPIDLPTSLEESTEYVNTTETVTMEQEMLLGFTYTIAKERYTLVDIWVLTAYARAGIDVDIRFGLRLPVNITLEYPEQMTVGDNYTFYATLTPIDKPSFNEFLFIFKAYVWVDAGIWVPFRWITYSATYGPNIDLSRSFQTPLGPEAEAPLPGINIKVFDSAWVIEFSLLKVFLTVEPAFGSEKITAKASSLGDARVVESADLTWSAPGQRLNFTVNAGDYDNTTDYAKISITDFKYYFTIFKLHVGLLFDFDSWIDWLTGDPSIRVATLDMSWIIQKLGSPYLSAHPGYPKGIEVTIYVERYIPPPEKIEPRDVAILYGMMHPETVYKGQTLNISVTIKNFGNVTENINVTLYRDTMPIEMQPVTEFEPNQETTLMFLLNTSNWALGNHTIWAEVSTVPNEIDATNNLYVLGTAQVIEYRPLFATISPAAESILLGQFIAFTSYVNGGVQPYSYQWYLNGNPISGGTLPIWTFTPTTIGNYTIYLIVSDSLMNTAKSNEALITVAPQLSILITPVNTSTFAGRPITFTSTVTGGYPPYSYQWYLDGNPVSGATSNTWIFAPTTSGIYYIQLKVTDAKGNTAQSETARVVVYTVPVGGYSISVDANEQAEPIKPYITSITILTIGFIAIKHKTNKKTKPSQ